MSTKSTDGMIYACLLMCIKSSFTTSSISLPPCLRHPPYQGWIFRLGGLWPPILLLALSPLSRCSRGRAYSLTVRVTYPGYALSISLICALYRKLNLPDFFSGIGNMIFIKKRCFRHRLGFTVSYLWIYNRTYSIISPR